MSNLDSRSLETLSETLNDAICDATSIDELATILNDAQSMIDITNEIHGCYNRLDDITDLTDLPVWGEMPANTEQVFSYDAEGRKLYYENEWVVDDGDND